MSVLSDIIAQYIDQQLDTTNGAVELCRSELADNFGCTPSQITYVLRTRFSPVRGYQIESRRGGGGYVRVWRISREHAGCVPETIRSKLARPMSRRQADEIIQGLVHMGAVDEAAGRLMRAAVSDKALQGVDPEQAAGMRSRILSQMLVSCMCGRPEDKQATMD